MLQVKEDGTFLNLKCDDIELLNYPWTRHLEITPSDIPFELMPVTEFVLCNMDQLLVGTGPDVVIEIHGVNPPRETSSEIGATLSVKPSVEKSPTTTKSTRIRNKDRSDQWKWHDNSSESIVKRTNRKRTRNPDSDCLMEEVSNNHQKKQRIYDEMTSVLRLNRKKPNKQ